MGWKKINLKTNDNAEDIRNKLELLQGDERLEIRAIKDLQEKLDELKAEIKKKNGTVFVGGGGVGKHNTETYDLSSSLDGVTKTFSLPAMWKIVAVLGTSEPRTFRPVVDYTFTPNSITFTSEIMAESSLAAGQTVIILYQE